MATRYRVHVFMGVEPTWELEYISGYTIVETRSRRGLPAPRPASTPRRDPISAVLTWDEARVTQTANSPPPSACPVRPEAALACRTRPDPRKLAAAGVPQPASILVTTAAEAAAAAEQIGYPVILKPSNLLLSMGVIRVDRAEDLEAAYATATGVVVPGRDDYVCTPLVEELVTGYEISVDCAVHEGEPTVLCIARKETGYPPYCIEVGHIVDAADPLRPIPSCCGSCRAAHAALGSRRQHPHRDHGDGVRPEDHRDQRPARRRPDPVPGPAGHRRGHRPDLHGRGLRAWIRSRSADRALVAGVRFFWVDADDTRIESIGFDRTGLPRASTCCSRSPSRGWSGPAPGHL